MSINLPEILQALATSQLAMVAPAMGETYVGKTANTIGILTLVTASLQDKLLQQGPALRTRLEQLLSDARLTDQALRSAINTALQDDAGGSWFARQDVLLRALQDLHAWADAHDSQLAQECRDFLVDHAQLEMIIMPDIPVTG